MAENLESDQKREDFTDAEKGEQKQLYRELDILEMKIKANTPTIAVMRHEDIADATRKMRECIAEGKRFELKISRAVASDFGGNSSGYADPATSTNPAPVTMGDIVEPLYSIAHRTEGQLHVACCRDLRGYCQRRGRCPGRHQDSDEQTYR